MSNIKKHLLGYYPVYTANAANRVLQTDVFGAMVIHGSSDLATFFKISIEINRWKIEALVPDRVKSVKISIYGVPSMH